MLLHKTMNEFKIISKYPNYSCNRDGKIKNNLTEQILNYSSNGEGYIRVGLKNIDNKIKFVRVHRIIAETFIENIENEKTVVDHIDRNRSNNCVDNLRWATLSENQLNSTKRENTMTKYKGVNYDKRHKKFTVRITFQGKRKYLGEFDTEEKANICRLKFIADNNILCYI